MYNRLSSFSGFMKAGMGRDVGAERQLTKSFLKKKKVFLVRQIEMWAIHKTQPSPCPQII
jgi:hypothetical protein